MVLAEGTDAVLAVDIVRNHLDSTQEVSLNVLVDVVWRGYLPGVDDDASWEVVLVRVGSEPVDVLSEKSDKIARAEWDFSHEEGNAEISGEGKALRGFNEREGRDWHFEEPFNGFEGFAWSVDGGVVLESMVFEDQEKVFLNQRLWRSESGDVEFVDDGFSAVELLLENAFGV